MPGAGFDAVVVSFAAEGDFATVCSYFTVKSC